MKRNQAFKNALVYLTVILLGLFIAFKVFWTQNGTVILVILAFFMVTFGCLLLSILLTRELFGRNLDFDFYTFTDKESLTIFKKKNGHKTATKISTIITCFCLVLIAVIIVLFIKLVNKYEFKQLSEYGIRQKVIIKNFVYKKSKYATFDFYFDDKKYSNYLDPKEYNVGDSVEIIFSSQNPDIVDWAEDFAIK